MSITTKILAVCLVVGAVISGLALNAVSAQDTPMTDAQITRIRSSCISAKTTLNQLHASDALLRVNRGQNYESMSTKLMSRFNNRVDSNRLDAATLMSVAKNYGTTFTAFRDDYKNYEVQLAATLKIDCSKEPVSFYDGVVLARTMRAQVHTDVVKLHQYINEYQTAFDLFQTNFNKSSEVTNK